MVSEKLVRAKLTNEDAACLVKSDAVYAMSRPSTSFRRLTSKDIAEAHQMTEALLALQVESKEEVNALLNKALAAGGCAAREAQDVASWMNGSLKTRMVICGTDGRRGFGSGRKRGN
jgi:predicted lactoylglutathione lyase